MKVDERQRAHQLRKGEQNGETEERWKRTDRAKFEETHWKSRKEPK